MLGLGVGYIRIHAPHIAVRLMKRDARQRQSIAMSHGQPVALERERTYRRTSPYYVARCTQPERQPTADGTLLDQYRQ